ncbi:MAG TPA: hypothetical protein VLP43_12240 [Solirubrobacteraceae bacterium]|nr:hypothetical protein [Solirubrobacteraceae bacterium]
MRRDELRALGRLAGESAGGLTARVHQTHRAVAQRAFHAVGLGAKPAALIHDERSPLELQMGLRVDGAAVAVERDAIARAYPDATPRVAVFVHGLGQSEAIWCRGGRAAPLGEALRTRLGSRRCSCATTAAARWPTAGGSWRRCSGRWMGRGRWSCES